MEVYSCYKLKAGGEFSLAKIVDSQEKAKEWLTELPLQDEYCVRVYVPCLVE